MYTEEQILEWQTKAKKWDELGERIGNIYEKDDDDEDLITIGEIAASAFGYL